MLSDDISAVLEEAPDSDLDRLRQYGALIIGVMVLFFVVVPGLFLYRAFTNPEGKIAEVLIVVFGLAAFQFTALVLLLLELGRRGSVRGRRSRSGDALPRRRRPRSSSEGQAPAREAAAAHRRRRVAPDSSRETARAQHFSDRRRGARPRA